MTARLSPLHELSAAEADGIAERFGLGAVRRFAVCAGGMVNSNYRLETTAGTFLLRLYPVDRDRAAIEFELSALRHLAQRRFPAPVPQLALDGRDLVEVAGRPALVLSYLPGRTLGQDELSIEIAAQVGRMYGHFGCAVQGFTASGCKPDADYPLVEVLIDQLLRGLDDQLPERAEIEQAWLRVGPEFAGPRQAPRLVHGDLYFENVLVDEDLRVTAFIDLDDSYLGAPLLDLAQVVMEFATPEDNELDLCLARAVLEGFLRHGPDLAPDPAELGAALVFQCCKFLCYTAAIQLQAGRSIADNDYFRRLHWHAEPVNRTRLVRAFATSIESVGAASERHR